MFNGVLQDWTTVSGFDGVITQDESAWADLGDASNVTFWVEVREVASDQGSVTLAYETAPVPEDALFTRIGAVVLGATASTIVTKVRLGADASNGLGRYLRWSLQGAGNWKANLRIFVAATRGLEGPRGASGDTSGLRLTLTSGVPVTTSDVSFTSTLYFTPFRSGDIVLYTGSSWATFSTDEISFAPALAASQIYDVFAYYDVTTSSVRLELSAAWTNTTTRADAVGRRDGIFVKTADPTRRMVGSIASDVDGLISDDLLRRHVWNADNRVDRSMLATESAASWLYAGATWRAGNNNTANAVSYLDGAGEDLVSATSVGRPSSSNASPQVGYVGVGLDSSTAVAAQLRGSDASPVAAIQCRAYYLGYPGIGLHTLYWIERAGGTVNVIFAGSPGADYQYGIFGTIKA